MPSLMEILLAIGIVVFVLMRQLKGEALQGKKLIVLPAALTVAGALSLTSHGRQPTSIDIACLVVSGLLAAAIGVGQGLSTRLEDRGGTLWARMPAKGLWWWAALIGSRLVTTGIAYTLDAHVATSTAPILMLLGINRLGQALVIAPRALASGVPFAPERDGSTFLSRDTELGRRFTSVSESWSAQLADAATRSRTDSSRRFFERSGRIMRAAASNADTSTASRHAAAPGTATGTDAAARPDTWAREQDRQYYAEQIARRTTERDHRR
jgi:hypothetical protein